MTTRRGLFGMAGAAGAMMVIPSRNMGKADRLKQMFALEHATGVTDDPFLRHPSYLGWKQEYHLGDDPWALRLAFADAKAFLREDDDAVREMLGRWVSELEPVLLRDHRGDLIGLTIAGLPLGTVAPIVVRRWPEEA